jgi:hypothetical protein
MDILNNKSNEELYQSILCEIAKSRNEVACARSDLNKANSRLTFVLAVASTLIDRQTKG